MYVTGTVSTGEHKVEAIPSEAIVNSEGKQYIFVLKGENEENGEKHYTLERMEVVPELRNWATPKFCGR